MLNGYVEGLAERLAEEGFERTEVPIPDAVAGFHRRRVSLRKFGFVDTLVVVFDASGDRTVEWARDRSEAAFERVLTEKLPLPRGVGSTAVVHPVFVGRDVDAGTSWVREYAPNHWASFEFPVVVDLADGSVAFHEDTPLWGALYYRGFRSFARDVLAPASGDG